MAISQYQEITASDINSAISGIVTQSITDGDTTHAPSGDAINSALSNISSSYFAGIDTSNVIASYGAGSRSGTASQDCWVVASGQNMGCSISIGGAAVWQGFNSNGFKRGYAPCKKGQRWSTSTENTGGTIIYGVLR